MTEPTVGLWHDARHQYYVSYESTGKVGPIPGVTGAIGMKDKPAIAYWRGTTVAKIIGQQLDLYRTMVETGGLDAAVAWAGKLPGYERDKAADTGTLVHVLVESILRKKEVTVEPELVPYAVAFRRFIEESEFTVQSVEQKVANLTDGWGGTYDLFGTDRAGTPTLLDVKTWRSRPIPGKDMYSETAMQLAAYGRGEFVGKANDPRKYRAPRPEAYGVLHLRPDAYDRGYAVWPFDVTDAEYDAFLGLLRVYHWQQTRARKVVGDPLSIRPKPEPSAPTAEAA